MTHSLHTQHTQTMTKGASVHQNVLCKRGLKEFGGQGRDLAQW